ncbi:MAG: hypothetical protein FJW40_15830 [Acidobacteria bacterium]|nr:hypothetical protein [Acidobacteriota bacterium]
MKGYNKMRTFASLSVLALALWAVPGPASAAEPALTGKWECTSTGPDGSDYPWTLTIKVDEGKITGVAGSQQGETPILEPKLEGSTLTFKQKIGPPCQHS